MKQSPVDHFGYLFCSVLFCLLRFESSFHFDKCYIKRIDSAHSNRPRGKLSGERKKKQCFQLKMKVQVTGQRDFSHLLFPDQLQIPFDRLSLIGRQLYGVVFLCPITVTFVCVLFYSCKKDGKRDGKNNTFISSQTIIPFDSSLSFLFPPVSFRMSAVWLHSHLNPDQPLCAFHLFPLTSRL